MSAVDTMSEVTPGVVGFAGTGEWLAGGAGAFAALFAFADGAAIDGALPAGRAAEFTSAPLAMDGWPAGVDCGQLVRIVRGRLSRAGSARSGRCRARRARIPCMLSKISYPGSQASDKHRDACRDQHPVLIGAGTLGHGASETRIESRSERFRRRGLRGVRASVAKDCRYIVRR